MVSTKTEMETRFIGHTDGEWINLEPGITAKYLYLDETSGERTLLVRFEAGSVYPLHNHPGKEEIFVLDGDIKVGKYVMTAGDYIYTPPDGKHAASTTGGGTVLIKLDKETQFIEKRIVTRAGADQ